MKQIDILEKLIEMTVKRVIREEMSVIKEELRLIKLGTAKILKEAKSVNRVVAEDYYEDAPANNSLASKIAVNEVNGIKRLNLADRPTPRKQILADKISELSPAALAEASVHAGYGDNVGLPEIDVPIGMFLNMKTTTFNKVADDINNT